MAKTLLEIVGGKITKGKQLPQESYRKFEPLFKALNKYIKSIKIEGYEVIFIDAVPPAVLLSLSPELQSLYGELLSGGAERQSAIVHLPSCVIIKT